MFIATPYLVLEYDGTNFRHAGRDEGGEPEPMGAANYKDAKLAAGQIATDKKDDPDYVNISFVVFRAVSVVETETKIKMGKVEMPSEE